MENNITSIIAYHGTTKENGEKIIQGNEFLPKFNPGHWLGQGVYFFENGHGDANWWNVGMKKGDKSIIKVLMKTKLKHVLNFDTSDDIKIFRNSFEKYKNELIENGISLNDVENLGCKIVCTVIDKYVSDDIFLIKKSFPYSNHASIGLNHDLRHTQLCVRNTGIIELIEEV